MTAALARQIAVKYARGQVDPGDAYIAGLLHDFGKAVFAQFMATEFHEALARSRERNIPLHEAELEVVGADHALVGSMLATKWQFPGHLVACIRDHHNAEAEPTALMDCVRVANQICRLRSIGDSGNVWREDEQMVAPQRFGSFEQIIEELGDLEVMAADAQTFAMV
jgi:HD-like signal output (HDOD) protein